MAFAFYFFDITSIEVDSETLFGKRKNISGTFYPNVKVWTAKELKKAGRDKDDSCLYQNAKNYGGRLVQCNMGNWQPFNSKKDKII